MINSGQLDEKQTVETRQTELSDEERRAHADVVSDPALADHVGTDWTDEGGATPDGPATTGEHSQRGHDFAAAPLTALMINCTLKRSGHSGHSSSGDVLGGQVLDALRELGTSASTIRAVDFNIAPGVETDMGAGDDWPDIRKKILAADILVLVTPTWLGQHSSVSQRVLERLNAESAEVGANGLPVLFGKVAIPVVVGNEDGAHHICAVLTQSFSDVGFSIAAQPSVYWNGEAMGKIDYQDLDHTPDSVAQAVQTSAKNSAHLARVLKQSPYLA